MRIVRRLGAVAAIAAALVAALEIAFRVSGLFVGAMPRAADDGRAVVLCVGDSHTRGRRDPDNYPAELQRLLDERLGARFRVVNVGVPGQNTAQMRSRFERYLGYYHPAVVLFWGGVNNSWNQLETDSWQRTPWRRLLDHSRLVRFVRVWRFYRGLRRAEGADPQMKLVQWKELGKARYQVNFGGAPDEIGTDPGTGEHLTDEQVERVTRDDVAAMMRLARDHGVPMYGILYPIRGFAFEPVNRAVRAASEQAGVPWVDANTVVERLGPRPTEELYDAWAHPTPMVYRAVAEDVYGLLQRHGVLGTPPPS
jgi:hypothetical protein